jgi:hypothetical protein
MRYGGNQSDKSLLCRGLYSGHWASPSFIPDPGTDVGLRDRCTAAKLDDDVGPSTRKKKYRIENEARRLAAEAGGARNRIALRLSDDCVDSCMLPCRRRAVAIMAGDKQVVT